jgi:hypothetical protein
MSSNYYRILTPAGRGRVLCTNFRCRVDTGAEPGYGCPRRFPLLPKIWLTMRIQRIACDMAGDTRTEPVTRAV